MRDIAIFGAGGLGREVATELKNDLYMGQEWNFIGFFDDTMPAGTLVSPMGKTLGGMDALNAWPEEIDILICLGYPKGRRAVASRITNPLVNFPNFINANTIIADMRDFSLGKGNILRYCGGLSTNCHFGDFNMMNSRVFFGHDATVGDFNSFMPGVSIAGNVTIGDDNLFGTGAIVIEKMKIGSGITLGPGSVLLTKPKDASLYIGNPARLMKY